MFNLDSIRKHVFAESSGSAINFSSIGISSGFSKSYAKYKAHGCLMVIAWMLFASTGILFARYYKYLFTRRKFFGLDFWFVIHRPIMVFVLVFSIIALLVILSQLDWKWISTDRKVAFTHSIFGIFAIIFAFIQVIQLNIYDLDYE